MKTLSFALLVLSALNAQVDSALGSSNLIDFQDQTQLAEHAKLVRVYTDENGDKRVEPITENEQDVRSFFDDMQVGFTGSVGQSTLQGLNGAFGIVLGTDVRPGWDTKTEGLLIELRPGMNGGMVSTGYMIRESRLIFVSSIAVTLDAYHSWQNSEGIKAGQTFLGASADLKIMILDLNIGILRRVSESNDADWKGYLGIGVGL